MIPILYKGLRAKKKGELTIFLALLLSVIMAFLITVISGVRKNMQKTEMIINSDIAIRACFAEYSKPLFDDFHLMYLDSSYGVGECEDNNIINHYSIYLTSNMNSGGIYKDDIEISDIQLLEVKRAKDNDYDDLRYQIKYYISHGENIQSDKEALIKYIYDCLGSVRNARNGYTSREEYEYLLFGNESEELNRQMAEETYWNSFCIWNEEDNGKVWRRYDFNDYENYLRESLFEMDEGLLLYRMVDVINKRIRSYGNEDFDIDKCICEAKLQIDMTGNDGYCDFIYSKYGYRVR